MTDKEQMELRNLRGRVKCQREEIKRLTQERDELEAKLALMRIWGADRPLPPVACLDRTTQEGEMSDGKTNDRGAEA